MYCPKCGKEIRDGARFCSGCGTPLKQASAPKKLQNQERKDSQEDQWIKEVKIQYKDKSLSPLTQEPLPAHKKKQGKKWGMIAAAALLIAVLAAAGAVVLLLWL